MEGVEIIRIKAVLSSSGLELELSLAITSKLYFVEAALVLEITPCPLTDKNRDSKNNF